MFYILEAVLVDKTPKQMIRSSIKTLSWDDMLNRGLQFGDGLFETMRVVAGDLPLWKWHWQRLSQSAKQCHLALPDERVIRAEIAKMSMFADEFVLKFMLFRKAKGRGYAASYADSDWVLQASEMPHVFNQPFKLSVAKLTLAEQPALAGLKHLNRLEQVMLARELAASNFDELVVCSQQGYVVEAVSQNILWLKADQWYTPSVDVCGVAGVGLAYLGEQLNIRTLKIKVQDLSQFDAMFLVNSVRGVSVVESVEGVKKFSTLSSLHDKIKRLWSESANL